VYAVRQVECGQSGKCSYLMNLSHPLSAKPYNESVEILCKVVTDVTEEGIIVAGYKV
jgi:hypothetical protein